MIVIYQPHADDAVFSIGAYLAALDTEMTIVTPFAGVPEDEAGKAKHTTLRREHDAVMATFSNATAVNGDFLDDVYPAHDRSEVRRRLAGWIPVPNWAGVPVPQAEALYIPLGVHHPDHVLTSNLVIDALRVAEYTPQLYFYDELPYRVLYPEAASTRMQFIENSIGRLELIEETFPTEPKERAVRLYESQVSEDLIGKLLVRERIWKVVR